MKKSKATSQFKKMRKVKDVLKVVEDNIQNLNAETFRTYLDHMDDYIAGEITLVRNAFNKSNDLEYKAAQLNMLQLLYAQRAIVVTLKIDPSQFRAVVVNRLNMIPVYSDTPISDLDKLYFNLEKMDLGLHAIVYRPSTMADYLDKEMD